MPSSQDHSDRLSAARRDFRLVIVLCLPSIIGTAFFLAGALSGPGGARSGDFCAEPGFGCHVLAAILVCVFASCYWGATFGPIFLPFAVWPCVRLSRAAGLGSRRTILGWTLMVLGVLAAAAFWSWLSHLDLFI